MKTPMQEHIEWLKKVKKRLESAGELGIALHIGGCIEHAESMLEKEKDMIIKVCEIGDWYYSGEEYYNQTFNTKER